MKVDFFIVGAPKSGTTSLYNYLSQHHSISMSSIKEPNFFSAVDIDNQKLYYKTKLCSDLKNYHSLFNFESKSCYQINSENKIELDLKKHAYCQ